LPDDLVARLEGKSSLGRLGLLIHSTAGYVDPGWKGKLTLELSNVAKLPIALYFGMKIGQISFLVMSSPVERPYGSAGLDRSIRARPSPPPRHSSRISNAVAAPPRAQEEEMTTLNDAVDWSADLGGGTRVALIQAGTFRSDAGALLGVVPRMMWNDLVTQEIDEQHRLLQALNCLLVETPAGRVLVETGIGDRISDKVRAMRPTKDRGSSRRCRRRVSTPLPSTPWPSATSTSIMRAACCWRTVGWPFPGPASWRSWRSGRSPWATTRGSCRVRPAGAASGARSGSRWHRGGRSRDPARRQRHTDRRPLSRSSGRADPRPGRDDRLPRRPLHAAVEREPALDHRLRRFSARLGPGQGVTFRSRRREGWTIVLSHEPVHPVGRLIRDRDRYRFEASV